MDLSSRLLTTLPSRYPPPPPPSPPPPPPAITKYETLSPLPPLPTCVTTKFDDEAMSEF